MVLLYILCVNLPAKMLLKIDTVWAFIKIVSIPDEEKNARKYRRVHRYILFLDVHVGLYVHPLHFGHCFALFAIVEGRLLLDIG